MQIRRKTAALALVAALPLGLAACGSNSSSDTSAGSQPSSSMSSSAPMTTPSDSMTSSGSGMDMASQPFGSACSAVPASGSGSFSGMAADPVATAASNNPVLSTLVTAVKTAGLVDTLNSQQAITVFAPANDAFAKIPAATLKSVLADKATLTKILTYHVVAGKISPDQLAGTHKTLEGQDLTVKGSGEAFTVGSSNANVICGNVQTANATVYIIDGVLMPPAA
ncbi:putative surface protein with fasciclin (FAS1) repeats [Lapillicoccus jejuensis]|uniref:Putative surface protein with fasciclin (FAS1) repeats n=2 Tax=Lapillicoccus jejuensis TaxID=402171 RepID=A0A542DZN0_9MICO|nr:putative surface protein with fasciclin (FAS1) repeats [Lapillicoccus jejuensis]